MSRPVFHAGPGSLDTARAGAPVTLTGADARHAATVRRVRVGEVIDLIDGAGLRVTGTVTDVAGGTDAAVTLTAETLTQEVRATPELVLVQALAKGGRDELAVEAGTEVGLDRVVPWQAERSVSQWRGEKARKGVARWQQVALAAAKQSRRAQVPAVSDLVVGAQLREQAAAAVEAGNPVLVLHEEASVPIGEAPITATAEQVLVVVGPEGGLTESEVKALTTAGAHAVRLGPHVLRTSTAGPIALALLAQQLGRWG
ncbi:16S rRNA (uracil(1498)-N(3))-methyltransferase [Ruania halotolerans]|uniref:16S rRNA (uracil(1498)-N(3))-methyltransferase n=1 Tax=Ruania halotolerans TaxID=2897773 RepID=UPI001E2CF46C|nr:16S rRNA (uracil(1498)-N(3))-methyltransferase [Ruania halotolerans]UFU04936.1 16S rRNA (uracil(1498)-N(3))-methyltransferase [Ruania halotolerans]